MTEPKKMKLNRLVELKAEQIAYLMCAGVPKNKIAYCMEMTYQGIDRITSTPEYQAIEERVKHRQTAYLDKRMDEFLERRMALSKEVENAVEEAIGVLLKKLRKDKDLRAALEILDRDPRHQFGKASRTQTEAAPASRISSEALAKAVEEADVTQKIMRSVNDLPTNQAFPKA